MKNRSHLTVARQLREKIHPSVFVLTIREGWEGGMCSAAMRELLRIVKDQFWEECAVPMVLGRKLPIWRGANVKTLAEEKTDEIHRR